MRKAESIALKASQFPAVSLPLSALSPIGKVIAWVTVP